MTYNTRTCAAILDAKYGLYMAWFCNEYNDQRDADCYVLPIAGYLPKALRYPKPLIRAGGSILVIEHEYSIGYLPPIDICMHLLSVAGDFVRNWRIARGMSQIELARAAKIDRAYLSQIENARRAAGWKTWAKLAAYMASRN